MSYNQQNKIKTMTTITYQQLHLESLFTINYSSLTENFKIMNQFIKDFAITQRKISDLQKTQKSTSQQLSNFKISTQNTFSTINQVMDSRDGLAKSSSNLNENEDFKEMKKSFAEIKKFITENTRDQHQAQTIRDQEQVQQKKQLDKKIQQTNKQIKKSLTKTIQLQTDIRELRLKLATKNELQSTKFQLKQNIKNTQNINNQVEEIKELLLKLNVKELKNIVDKIDEDVKQSLIQIKKKVHLKADVSDTIKLEEMMLNIINFTYEHICKKLADKTQTKKALVFLEKRINKIVENIYGDEVNQKDAILAGKSWKCISCTKDLGEIQGKLDKYKAWSVFPVKQTPSKDRYSGFGAGFQTIIETTATKKGLQSTFDEKGRMTTPFNLTREVHTNLKHSQSQSKQLKAEKPLQMQTNFMLIYGKNNEVDIDLKEQYTKKYRGLLAFIKLTYESKKQDTQT